MQSSDSDSDLGPMHKLMDDWFSQTSSFSMHIDILNEERTKMTDSMESLNDILTWQMNLNGKFEIYQNALIEKMKEIKKLVDPSQLELKQKLEELQEIINKG